MKILIIANSTIGLVKFRKDLIKRLYQNHEVYIATKFDECQDELQGFSNQIIEVDMERRGTNLIQEFKLVLQYWRIIRGIKPELVITYTIKPNIYGGIIARINHIPYVANITGLGTAFQKEGFFKEVVILLYKIALKKSKVVFFENRENQRLFLDSNIVKEEKTWVLNGAGVNLSDFSVEDYPKSDKINFLFLGRVMKEKGVDELFEAMQLLRRDNLNVFLTVVGGCEENYSDKITELVDKGIINYVGWVADVHPYIRDCMCSVLPSYHEGMSNTLLESAAMGRPLIASNIHGCKEAIIDGKSGYCVKKMDSHDLYCKMKQFVELSWAEKEMMGKASREHVEKVFDKRVVVETTVERMELL